MDPAPSPAAVAVSPVSHHSCLNCGTALSDRFCSHCGQAADTHRITLAHWLHDIPHSVWHVDRGLPHTIRQMLRRPGATMRGYLAGQRVPYFRPLTYVLLLTGLVSLLYVTLHLKPYNTHDPNLSEALREMQSRFLQQFTRYLQWFTVLMLPLTAALIRLILRRGGFNYAECITIGALVVGTSSFLNLAGLPFLLLSNGTATGQLLMLGLSAVMFGYQTWAYGDLLAHTGMPAAGRYLRGLLVSVINYTLVVLVGVLVLLAANWTYFVQSATGPKQAGSAPQEALPTKRP